MWFFSEEPNLLKVGEKELMYALVMSALWVIN